MITKYVVRYGGITKVNVIRETDKCVFISDRLSGERKELKSTSYHNFFDCFEDAKNFLVTTQEEKIKQIRMDLERHNGKLGQLKGLKIENVKED